jgi:6-pyruvoyl-tetrahydropterin synthase related domain
MRLGSQGRWKSFADKLTGPAIILLAAAVAIAPQLVRGNSCGHDFDFHLVSWLDAQHSWRQGILYPHWTPSANYGAGEPRFVFYSPLTWMLGAALGLMLPWSLVPVALTFLLLAGTGLASRALAREALSDGAATLAGCVALFSGYALFTAYERSAFAELAGGFWIPLVLLFALRNRDATTPVPISPDWRRALDGSTAPLALALAGAWLSNPTVGVMACYLLAGVAPTLALLSRSWAPVLRASTGAVLGMGLAAIYLVPAAWEQRWVDIHQVTEDPGQTLENNWLFARHADPSLALHDAVLRQASIIAVIMIAVALGGLLVSWLRERLPGKKPFWVPLALIPVAVLFLQFPISRPVWNLLPNLRFLQFPWRWLVVLEAPMAIFLASAVWPRDSARRWRRTAVVAACAAVFLAMTAYAGKSFFQSCDDEDAVVGMLDTYRSGQGFPGTDEYEPLGADNSLLATGLPAACLVSDPSTALGAAAEGNTGDDIPPAWSPEQGSCEATFVADHDQVEQVKIAAVIPQSGYLILRLRSYPAWRVTENGRPITEWPQRDDGLMAVPVPQGHVNLAVDWITTPDVLAGRWLSGIALLLLIALWLNRPRLSSVPRLS